jgi:hypothetical protein
MERFVTLVSCKLGWHDVSQDKGRYAERPYGTPLTTADCQCHKPLSQQMVLFKSASRQLHSRLPFADLAQTLVVQNGESQQHWWFAK